MSLSKKIMRKFLLGSFKLKIRALMTGNFKSFTGYEEALKSCKSNGYEDSDLVSSVVRKTELSLDSLNVNQILTDVESLRIHHLLENNFKSPATVLDFGGGAGIQFFKNYIIDTNHLIKKWIVVETPKMAKTAIRLKNKKLNFTSDFSDAGKIDFFFANSSIQYCDNLEEILLEVLSRKPKFIYLCRTPFNLRSNKIISTQRSLLSKNGPRVNNLKEKDTVVEYPIIFYPYEHIHSLLSKSYEIIFKQNLSQSAFMHLRGEISTLDLVYKQLGK